MADVKIITKDVLKVIAVGGLVISAGVFPALPVALGILHKEWKNAKRRDLGKIIKRLEKQEMISIREENNKVQITITEKGKRRLLEYDYENIKLKKKQRDGKWRLIIFDIPEGLKQNRNALARKLLQIDCVRLQDSVYASAYPCKDEIDFLCNFLEISDYVTLVILGKIERGEELLFKQYKDWDNEML